MRETQRAQGLDPKPPVSHCHATSAYRTIEEEREGRTEAVTCDEAWEAVDETGEIVTKHSRHAWISSRRLNRHNVHERCNIGARHRWGIEV